MKIEFSLDEDELKALRKLLDRSVKIFSRKGCYSLTQHGLFLTEDCFLVREDERFLRLSMNDLPLDAFGSNGTPFEKEEIALPNVSLMEDFPIADYEDVRFDIDGKVKSIDIYEERLISSQEGWGPSCRDWPLIRLSAPTALVIGLSNAKRFAFHFHQAISVITNVDAVNKLCDDLHFRIRIGIE